MHQSKLALDNFSCASAIDACATCYLAVGLCWTFCNKDQRSVASLWCWRKDRGYPIHSHIPESYDLQLPTGAFWILRAEWLASKQTDTHTHTWYLDMKYLCHAKIWMRGQISLKTAFVAELCSRFTRSPNTLSFLCKRGFADPMRAIRIDKEGQLMNFSVCVCDTSCPILSLLKPSFCWCPGAEWQQALCILVPGYERLEVCADEWWVCPHSLLRIILELGDPLI